MFSRKLLRIEINAERFLSKSTGANDPLESFRKTDDYIAFENMMDKAINDQITYVIKHLDEIKIWDNNNLQQHQIDAVIATYLDHYMPISKDSLDYDTIYNCFKNGFVWSVQAAYKRLGVKMLQKKAKSYTQNFELTNQDYLDALSDDSNYLLTTKSTSYDTTTKNRLITTVRDSRLAQNTIDETADLLNKAVDTISSVRAFMIANTETANAFGTANQAFLTENNIPQKEWVIAGPHNLTDECDDNADASPIDATDTFPSGDLSEPAHTNCECYTNGVGLDLTTMSNDQLDSLILWDGS